MFNILHDSIFYPKGLLRQVKKSGWFTSFYILVLSIFMSLGMYNLYLSYDNPTFNESTTGCDIVNYKFVCDGDNYNVNTMYDIYGVQIFFLNENMTVNDISSIGDSSIILQGSDINLYRGKNLIVSQEILSSRYGDFNTISDVTDFITHLLFISGIISNTLMNFMLILTIILISTIMFYRFRYSISYKKRFKLVTFAITPIALLITFYNLLNFDSIIFFVIAFFAYRPLFALTRELNLQLAMKEMEKANEEVEENKEEDEDE